jgi:hypothetical protein
MTHPGGIASGGEALAVALGESPVSGSRRRGSRFLRALCDLRNSMSCAAATLHAERSIPVWFWCPIVSGRDVTCLP